MPSYKVLNMEGKELETIELSDDIFNQEDNPHLIYQVVVNHLANRRQGTQSTLTRAEVRGGGRKPWKQKGTGRARQGSIRSPQWKGGGVVFAPKPRSYAYKLPKKLKRLALKVALSNKVRDNELIIIDDIKLQEVKTKFAFKALQNLNAKKAYIVTKDNDKDTQRAFRNIPFTKISEARNINVYDIVRHDNMILTKDALETIEEVFK